MLTDEQIKQKWIDMVKAEPGQISKHGSGYMVTKVVRWAESQMIPSCDDPSPEASAWWHENAFAETFIEEGIDGPIIISQGPVQVVLDDDQALEFIRVKFGFDDKNTILDILTQWHLSQGD